MKKRRIVSMLLAGMMAISAAGCGNAAADTTTVGQSAQEDTKESKDASQKDFVTWDFYCQQASYQGIQGGWYGKVLKDKLNIELNIISPVVSGGGDSLYQTRSISGDLGDIVVLDYAKMKECVENGLVIDLSSYLGNCENISQYQAGIDNLTEYIGEDGVYAIPLGMSTESPTKIKLDNGMVNEAPLLPWDYYKELGMPEIQDTDDLLDVMEQMQQAHPTTADGKKTYGFSIFKDWDWKSMAMAERITLAYGYAQTTPSIFTNADCTKTQLLTEDGGAYYNALKLLFKANQRGLVDPDSSAQDYATMSAKVQNKEVLYVWYPWMATVYNNTHKNTGDGYAYIPVGTQEIVTNGYNPYGSDGMCIGIGSGAEDPERIMEYLDWSCSPEALQYYAGTIEGLTWEMNDGRPERTEFGKNLTPDTVIPDEFGGGTYETGSQKLTASIGSKFDINPETGESYDPTLWTSKLEEEQTQQDTEWSERFGAENPQTWLEENNKVEVIPGSGYIASEESTELKNKRNQCNTEVIQASWQMVFASDEAEFEQIWSNMKEELKGLGYDDVIAADTAIVEQIKAARQEAVEAGK